MWLKQSKKKKNINPFPNDPKFPDSTTKLHNSTDSIKGTDPGSEETFPETIYPSNSSAPNERHEGDMEYDSASKYMGGRRWLDYPTTSNPEC